jgi:ABC-type Mn2+/Zn2+ transport system ATPase subunit
MRTIKFHVETKLSTSVRARQLSSMFDAPPEKKCRIDWQLDVDLDTPWSVGLVTGPSGSGKSTLMRELWGEPKPLEWSAPSVVDDFPKGMPTVDVAAACQAVGFNTIPAWMRPFAVLSNGEKFRVELARRLITGEQLVVIDEFTSVVDRQVAQIGAHAVQKYIRRSPGDNSWL